MNRALETDQKVSEAKREFRAMARSAMWEVDEILGLNEAAWRRELAMVIAKNRLITVMHHHVAQAFVENDGMTSALLANRICKDVRELRKLMLTPERWKTDDISDLLLGMRRELWFGDVKANPLLRHLMGIS